MGIHGHQILDKVKLKTLKRGRPRKRIKVLAADKGYDSKQKRADLRKRGIRPQIVSPQYFGVENYSGIHDPPNRLEEDFS